MMIKAQYILLLVSVCLLGAHAHNHELFGNSDSESSAPAAAPAPVAVQPPVQPVQQAPVNIPVQAPPPVQQPIRQQPVQPIPQQPIQQQAQMLPPRQQQPIPQQIQQPIPQQIQQPIPQQIQQPIPQQIQQPIPQQFQQQASFVPQQQQQQPIPSQSQFVPQQQADFVSQQQQPIQSQGDFNPMDTISVIESQIARSHRIHQMQMQTGFDASSMPAMQVSQQQGPSVLVRQNAVPSVPVRGNFQQSVPIMPIPQRAASIGPIPQRSVPVMQVPQQVPSAQGPQPIPSAQGPQPSVPIMPVPQRTGPIMPTPQSVPVQQGQQQQQPIVPPSAQIPAQIPVKQPNPLVTPPMNLVKDIPVDSSTSASNELNPVNQIVNLPQSVITGASAPKFCTFTGAIKCDPNFPYRSLDGSCNNLKNLWWGKDQMPYKRYLKPAYGDGQNQPRISIDGSELPNPTEISCNLHSDSYEIEPFVTHIFMQWGQILNHDTTSLSVVRDEEKSIARCKSCKRTEKCLPMNINPNGKGLCAPNMKHGCVEFARATAAFPDTTCTSSVREQLNLVSSFLDASFAYGNTPEDLEKLRDRSSGKGMMMLQPVGLLPQDINQTQSECLDFTRDKQCFRAGDDRVNQNPGLSSMQTVFIREHNRIARILSTMNPNWQDETVFQETRKIVIAELQHITYNEYLPLLLGEQTAKQLDLIPGIGNQQLPIYDPNVDPRISNEYAAGAGRFGHSTIRPLYSRLNNEFSRAGHSSFMLRNSYFRSNMLYDHCQGSMESIIRGLVKDPLMKVDKFFAHDLTKHLFETLDDQGNSFHFDLVAINIQRARDNGIPSYSAFRDACNLSPVKTWEDMSKVVPSDVLGVLRQFYKFAEDVDLFPAMVSEHKEPGSLIGPTIKCIVGQQFRDLKFGDRFWYETNQDPIRFTPDQLSEIRKISLAKLLCRNMIDTPKMPPQAFLSTKFTGNDFVPCDSLSDINWSFWQS